MSDEEPGLKAWSMLLAIQARTLRKIEASLRAEGLPPLAWYDVLWELEQAGGELRLGEIAERLVVEPYNATRLVDRLKAEGLVRRERAADDKRGACAVLTDKGRALRRRMWPHYRHAIITLFAASLSANEAISLLRGLRKMAERLCPAAPEQA